MLQHLVFLKTRPDLEKEKFDRILTDAREKLVTIPGVSNLRAGTPLESECDWTICLSMDFEDDRALEAYRVHPTHVAYVKNNLADHVIERMALDYWMT